MAIHLDKIVYYAPIFLLVCMFLAVLLVEAFGCKWSDIFNLSFDSIMTPGIKVIG